MVDVCPKCKSPRLTRVHRGRVDWIIDYFLPVKRLGCDGCGWSALVRRTSDGATPKWIPIVLTIAVIFTAIYISAAWNTYLPQVKNIPSRK